MKNTYLLIAFVCLITTYSFGQADNSVQFGIKIGANYSNIYDIADDNYENSPKLGFATGVFLSIPIADFIGIQPEVLFSQKGYKAEGNFLGSPYTLTRTTNYIDIPLLISIKPVESLTILAGPQYSYLTSQSNKFENSIINVEQEEAFDNENLRKNMLCFTGGFDINISQIVIGGRVGWDLYKNNGDGTTTTPRYKNVWYQCTIGFRL